MKSKFQALPFILLFITHAISYEVFAQEAELSGELKKWHGITLTFNGPETSEDAPYNPFLNYRLDVEFSNGDKKYTIPGFYAADGNAANTSATRGNKWQVRFSPDKIGTWTYKASFRKGINIAVNDDPNAGEADSFDGASGSFEIAVTDKTGRDLRGHGRLQYVNEHYLQFSETGDFFIKGGTNSPENLLAFHEFDNTPPKHKYPTHVSEWKEGDVTWKNGKGKGIVGAMNYLASTGINSVYFLTMNVMGDGNDVWPWIASHERYRFDVSKLDQWELVFGHMDRVGLMKHVITQETENENLLDIGQVGIQRKLYYRELIARFAHHMGVFWNMGEENGITGWSPVGQTEKMRIDMVEYMKALDPYGNFVAIHTLPELKDHTRTMEPFLGNSSLDGVSFQIHHLNDAYFTTSHWRKKSAEAGKKWIVWIDEIGPANAGVLSDIRPIQQDTVRKNVIWANLMAGGAGVEHYFGYKHQHTDLNSEDWHVRDRIWKMTYTATSFFQEYLPFTKMQPNNDLIDNKEGYCFAQEGEVYAVYLKNGDATILDLKDNTSKYSVQWYNPRSKGKLFKGSKRTLSGSGKQSIGSPPTSGEDWVALIRKK